MSDKEEIKRSVQEFYARVAADASIVCPVGDEALMAQAKALGYAEEEIKRLPKGALVGLGCSNPLSFAELKEGEIVLDFGSGGGSLVNRTVRNEPLHALFLSPLADAAQTPTNAARAP